MEHDRNIEKILEVPFNKRNSLIWYKQLYILYLSIILCIGGESYSGWNVDLLRFEYFGPSTLFSVLIVDPQKKMCVAHVLWNGQNGWYPYGKKKNISPMSWTCMVFIIANGQN